MFYRGLSKPRGTFLTNQNPPYIHALSVTGASEFN